MAIFAPDERLPSSATLIVIVIGWGWKSYHNHNLNLSLQGQHNGSWNAAHFWYQDQFFFFILLLPSYYPSQWYQSSENGDFPPECLIKRCESLLPRDQCRELFRRKKQNNLKSGAIGFVCRESSAWCFKGRWGDFNRCSLGTMGSGESSDPTFRWRRAMQPACSG